MANPSDNDHGVGLLTASLPTTRSIFAVSRAGQYAWLLAVTTRKSMTVDMPEPESEFPHGIGRVAKRELALNGYTRYDQLTTTTATDLLKIHGVGEKAVRILGEELAKRGQSFGEGA
jgi:hypothetical protein